MELYKIITDEEKLIEFINWLPELKNNEQYYLSLFARKKYCPELIKSNDKTQLKRFTATKKNILDKIKGLEKPLGRWKLRETEAPQESLVLYIHPNPRDMKKATRMMGKKCWDLERSNNFNLVAEAMSCVQKSIGTRTYVHFDIDETDINLELIKNIFPKKVKYSLNYNEKPIQWLEEYPFYWVQTRGGYHLLINPELVTRYNMIQHHQDYHGHKTPKDWFREVVKLYNVEQSGDLMLPVPGTYQGGFTPKFINI